MADRIERVLVVGATGFIGSAVTRALVDQGSTTVRCLTRTADGLRRLQSSGVEVVQGDMTDQSSMNVALHNVDAVYLCVHTLGRQHGRAAREGFMAVEAQGVQNVIDACRLNGTTRVVYLTSLGTSPAASSEWLRQRWQIEQTLLGSGLNVTIIRPGQIVGAGGRGFETVAGQAKRSVAVLLGGAQPMRTIALHDLVEYLLVVLGDPRTYGVGYDVGSDDVLSIDTMVDIAAEVLGRAHPTTIHLPRGLLRLLAPAMERFGRYPTGSMRGFLDSLDGDAAGDTTLIRELVPLVPIGYRAAAQRVLLARTP